MGSGTQGLHRRTSSPPPRAGLALGDNGTGSSSSVRSTTEREGVGDEALVREASGARTMYCRGMVMRWGEQEAQTTRPHFRQWCFRYQKLNTVPQIGQLVTSVSGCHRGRFESRSPSRGLLSASANVCVSDPPDKNARNVRSSVPDNSQSAPGRRSRLGFRIASDCPLGLPERRLWSNVDSLTLLEWTLRP